MSNLDLTAQIKLFKEIQLNKLLSTSVEAVMRYAGSKSGCLLWFDFLGEILLIKASIVDDAARTEIDLCTNKTIKRHLPASIINHAKTSGETVAINSASENNFIYDPYFTNFQPRAILCIPIVHQHQVQGMFYLENYLVQPTRKILNTLCSQTAITLENANIYFNVRQAQIQERETTALLEASFKRLQDAQQELLETQKKLEYDAFHDVLTGLPNRTWLLKLLERSIELAARHPHYHYALLFIDLDGFKAINDNLGHLAGDEFLRQIAQRLQTCLRTTDTISRLGGDEFAILLEIGDPEEATSVVERIIAQSSVPLFLNGEQVFASTSIGIAFGSPSYKKPKDILRDADVAMYRAKAQGKGRYVVFDRNMEVQIVTADLIKADLKLETALALEQAIPRQELSLYYQPIVETATGLLSGFEVLLRWNRSTQGSVAPRDFIPIAEETGVISEICWWVITSACRQLRFWRERFPQKQITLNINLSPLQLKQENLLQRLKSVWEENQLLDSSIKLEIAESCILDPSTTEAQTLMRLKDSGIGLCVDDFGIGYSSLSHLREFPIDTLKIDRSFVRRLGQTAGRTKMVQTIITLAHSLEMDVIAEGVETIRQFLQLQQLNCEYIQGYLISQPLDSVAATEMLESDSISDRRSELTTNGGVTI